MIEGTAQVELTVIKRTKEPQQFRIVSIDDTAKAPKDYKGLNQEIVMRAGETERMVAIDITDDDEWEPDKDFYVKLCKQSSAGQE